MKRSSQLQYHVTISGAYDAIIPKITLRRKKENKIQLVNPMLRKHM